MRLKRYFKRVTIRHWAWIHFKLSLGVGWGTAVLFVTAPAIRDTIDQGSIQVWAMGTILGGLVSIVGIFMTCARTSHWQIRGLGVEVVGIILLGGGPFQYLLIQVSYLLSGQFDQRYQLAWFAYAMLSAIIVRMLIIAPKFIEVVVAIKKEKDMIDNA